MSSVYSKFSASPSKVTYWKSIYWKILGAAVWKTAVSSEITPGFLSEVIIYSGYPLPIPT